MDTLEAISTRRSIRRFKKNPVSKNVILKLLDAAKEAPSGGNMQPWRFIVVRHRSAIEEMGRIIRQEMVELPKFLEGKVDNPKSVSEELAVRYLLTSLFFVQAPVTIAVCVEETEPPLLTSLVKSGMDKYDAACYLGFTNVKSASAATENLLLAAHSLGLGACWMNIPFFAKDKLENFLHVKRPYSLFALIPIGKPDHAPQAPAKLGIHDISVFVE